MPINKVVYGDETLIDLTDSTLTTSDEIVSGVSAYNRSGELLVGTADYMDKVTNPTANDILVTDANGQATDSGVPISTVALLVDLPNAATETDLGLIKLNPSESITLNADNQLDVGGRLGQFPNGGLFYPTTANPMRVGNYTLLMTDAVGLGASNRNFIIAGGNNVTLRGSHAAGSTVYRVSNSYANRIGLNACKNGFATLAEATAPQYTVPILSIKFANGNDISPYSGPTESDNDIIITTNGSANPDSVATSIRCYGYWATTDIVSVGQCNGSNNGKCLQVGMLLRNEGNQTIQVGNAIYSSGANSAQFGRQHINKKTDSLLAGYGHDNSNGRQGSSALCLWSVIKSNTMLAVGNGTSDTARSNAFEVLADGRAKISGTPTESDDLVTKAYVDSVTTYGNADFTYEKVLDPATQEVINECVAYSTVSGNAEEPKAVKYGRVVNMTGAFKNINVRPDTGTFVMGKVPSGCEPLYRQSILVQGTSQAKFLLTIETDGTLKCARYSTGASAIAVPNNAWLNINATYISAS